MRTGFCLDALPQLDVEGLPQRNDSIATGQNNAGGASAGELGSASLDRAHRSRRWAEREAGMVMDSDHVGRHLRSCWVATTCGS